MCWELFRSTIALAACAVAVGYGSAVIHSRQTAAANNGEELDSPVTVPLIKLEYPGNPPNIRMLYIRVLSLGEHKVDQPLLFDTGSAGITIDCLSALPMELCSVKGIKIKKPLELDGLTVTTQRLVSHYGTYDEYGNLALARVTFGSEKEPISTSERIPILIRYKQVVRATGEIVGGYLWPKGIFGVSPVGGQADGKLKSPMNSITVGPGLHRGFYLSPVGSAWRSCTNEQRDCPEVAALHVGIDGTIKSDFSVKKWKRVSSNYNFPTENVCIAWQGHSVCKPTLYDTGNSTIQVASKPPKGRDVSLPVGMEMTVTGKAHEKWIFTTQYQPEVEFIPKGGHHTVGIRYFEENSLLFDLETKEIGFRIGK